MACGQEHRGGWHDGQGPAHRRHHSNVGTPCTNGELRTEQCYGVLVESGRCLWCRRLACYCRIQPCAVQSGSICLGFGSVVDVCWRGVLLDPKGAIVTLSPLQPAGTKTSHRALDDQSVVRELTGTFLPKVTYLTGPRGVEYRRDDQSGTARWYVYDGLGSVMGEVSPDGTLTRTQSFDVYGAVRTSSGTATTKHKFVGSLGHPSDDETGLVYMRARYYDPVVGRFASEDPGRNGANWFAYCSDNPVNAVDEDGRATNYVWLVTRLFVAVMTSDLFCGAFFAACCSLLLPLCAEIAAAGSVVGGATWEITGGCRMLPHRRSHGRVRDGE